MEKSWHTLQIHHFHVSIFLPKATEQVFSAHLWHRCKRRGTGRCAGSFRAIWHLADGTPSANRKLVKHLTYRTPPNHWSVGRAKPLYITEMEREHTTNLCDAPHTCFGQFQHHSLPVSYTVLCRNTHQFGWFDTPPTSQLFTGARVGMLTLECSYSWLEWSSSLQMQRWQLTWVLEVHLLLCCWFPPRVPHCPTRTSPCHRKVFWWRSYYAIYVRTTIGKVWKSQQLCWVSTGHHIFDSPLWGQMSFQGECWCLGQWWLRRCDLVRMAFEYHLNHLRWCVQVDVLSLYKVS